MNYIRKQAKKLAELIVSIKVGFFLAVRQLRRSSFWTTGLIIFVMTLTFLNLVVVSGILVGLIQGATDAVRERYISDVIIIPLKNKDRIENSQAILATARTLPWAEAVSGRYSQGGLIEANYKNKIRATDVSDEANTTFAGVNLEDENAVTDIESLIIEGSFIRPTDYDEVVVGSMLLKKYFPDEVQGFATLDHVAVGDKVRVTLGGNTREVRVKGIIKAKVDEISRRVFFTEKQFRDMAGINDFNYTEISIKAKDPADSTKIRDALKGSGYDTYAQIKTFDESKPKFLNDLVTTFNMLGNAISSIGLAVASITTFIVIFINAITRRKFIGIMKGIGISEEAIEFSYVFQSIFYAIGGSLFGLALLYGVLRPYFDANPIDFPFSDGILAVTTLGVSVRVAIMIITTIIAGYIPARLITKKNTLDSILGR